MAFSGTDERIAWKWRVQNAPRSGQVQQHPGRAGAPIRLVAVGTDHVVGGEEAVQEVFDHVGSRKSRVEEAVLDLTKTQAINKLLICKAMRNLRLLGLSIQRT